MKVTITPRPLRGDIAAIPSKSDAHRRLLLASVSDGTVRLPLGEWSADMQATARCIEALGGRVRQEGSITEVTPIGRVAEKPALDCGESGSTLRFVLPLAACLCDGFTANGEGRLPHRPLWPLLRQMAAHGCRFSGEMLPLAVAGRLTAGGFLLPGDVSSQFVSGLLMALPLLNGDSVIRLQTPLESAAYVELTRQVQRDFGVETLALADGFAVRGGQRYHAEQTEMPVEGDWSNAAFWLAAGVTVTGLSKLSCQPDRAILDILERMGNPRRAIDADMRECPDLAPVTAALMASAAGVSRLTGAARLRLKESDRLTAMAQNLRLLGGTVEEQPDGLIITGGMLHGGTVDACGDHRIAMAMAVAATACTGKVSITGAQSVDKSYPAFWRDYQALGGVLDVAYDG